MSESDGVVRCGWATSAPEFVAYHDEEWGHPVHDDRALFEKLSLEGFQSGLSWRTIYNKREAFREDFHGFDWTKVAAFGEDDVQRLLADARIVRHRGKIEAVVNNAARLAELVDGGESFAELVWSFQPPARDVPSFRATCPEAEALSKALKKRGWRFVGPTTVYSMMQACGLVDDHDLACAFRGPAASSES